MIHKVENKARVFDMIRLLRENGKMTAKQLTLALGYKNTRSITDLKECIKKLGYNIKAEYGNKGGYSLIEEHLTDYEIKLIAAGLDDNSFYLLEKIKRINNRI